MADQMTATSLLPHVRTLFERQEVSRTWDEIEELVRWDPQLFDRSLKRAANWSYSKARSSRGDMSLWIACNLVDTMRKAPWCYFCFKPITRDEFLRGVVHLEHFHPRASSGTHEPANITLACEQCDALKSHLTHEDFAAILEDADAFFAGHRRERAHRPQLVEFAEIYYPRIAGLPGYARRHGIPVQQAREHWEAAKREYRQKWQTPN